MSRRSLAVRPQEGPLAVLGDAALDALDLQLDDVDSANEAEPGRHASADTLRAGQDAVDAINSRRGRK